MNLTYVDLAFISTILAAVCIILIIQIIHCIKVLSDRNDEIRALKCSVNRLTNNVLCINDSMKEAERDFTERDDRHATAIDELQNAHDAAIQTIADLKKYITSLRDRLSYISDCTNSNFPIPRNSPENNPSGELYRFLTEGFDKPILEHLTEQDTPVCTSSRTHSRQ